MSGNHLCPACGASLPADAPEGLCPQCLLKRGLEDSGAPAPAATATPTTPYREPFAVPAPAELAGLFPQLEILELLGQGGMGAVYKARQTKLDRLVALKILPAQAGRDAAFAGRFAREARALARLYHPHIVSVHDFGEAGGLYYFLMEYVDGVNVRQLLGSGPLAPVDALRIIPQICEALQYAHDEGVVHRDIKPENILVDRKGRVKIADFGLAKLLDPARAAHPLTHSQQIMGTPHYMAPEQMERPQAVDQRADIYSLGVVFYEMLTGELPLGQFVPPSQKVSVDARLDAVVLRALAREPERRYQQVSEVKTDLDKIAERPPELGAAAARDAAAVDEDTAIQALSGWPRAGSASWAGLPASAAETSSRLVRRSVVGAANGLLFAGLLSLLSALAVMLWCGWTLGRIAAAPTEKQTSSHGGMTITLSPKTDQFPRPLFLWLLLASQLLAAGAATVTLLAAASMRKLESHQLATAGTILALLPCSAGWLVGLPMGLRALMVLRRPAVRSAFDLSNFPVAGSGDPATTGVWTPSRALWLGTAGDWTMLACLLGAGATFLPWARVYMFGFVELAAGFDSWHGIVTGLTFLASFLVLVAATFVRPLPAWRAVITLIAGLVAGVVAGMDLWESFRGPAITQSSVSGNMPGMEEMAKAFTQMLVSGLRATPHIGPYLTLVLGVGLLVLGYVQLREVRKRNEALPASAGETAPLLNV